MREERPRPRELGLVVGWLPPGPHNAITDVAGVRVGHRTVWRGEPEGEGPVVRTGVTAILPHPGNLFRERLYAATSVLNGYGEMTGSRVIDEWGLLGTPILLTGTVSVGRVYDAAYAYMMEQDSAVGSADVAIPVVAECWDGFLSDDRARPLSPDDTPAAIGAAGGGPVAEGCVGAGTGMQMFGFKGGIGTASRRVEVQEATFTVGVLLLTNYGSRHQLTIRGVPVGREIIDLLPERQPEGSCIAVVATDAPLHPLQLRRLARRVDIGLGRTGSVGNDGSGEMSVAFSTANRIPRAHPGPSLPVRVALDGTFLIPPEDVEGESERGSAGAMDLLFEAVAEATEEAALNALFRAATVRGRDSHVLHALPIGRALDLLRSWRLV